MDTATYKPFYCFHCAAEFLSREGGEPCTVTGGFHSYSVEEPRCYLSAEDRVAPSEQPKLSPFARIEKIVRQQAAGLLTAEEAQFEHYLILVGCTASNAG